MNYLLKSSNFEDRKRQKQKRILFIAIGLFILCLIINTSPVRNLLFSIAKPAWQLKNSFLNSNFLEYFKSKSTLLNEKMVLEQKLFLVANTLALNDVLQKENEMLKDVLERKDIKLKTILASVLVKPPQIPYDSLIIDIGENQKIRVGNKVVANANIYIGEVSEVYPDTAKVILYSSPNYKLPVILGKNFVGVEAVGMGGGNFNIHVPREVEVTEGDTIVIPSISPNIFGIVEKINFKEADSFQTVLFKSPVNISELSFVEVVI